MKKRIIKKWFSAIYDIDFKRNLYYTNYCRKKLKQKFARKDYKYLIDIIKVKKYLKR